ncbi:LacI family DNA-binding transcriptional regulator [Caballeronia sp. LZ065]|uniref:LacI family DNA-binding transcriptional regulator n=1 Tax=Caballeronia sp. LZ065 TaxID=3038571 RepID=UPI00285FE810|nr:LacI family DNA-binding transcriptional regulator [Caballeronia sp. LZ065]MDR5784899.1 LacI family DNA-binding transcriptional regulator [Caballeronia sp. LZ065]
MNDTTALNQEDRPRLSDVAALAGVSTATVSRALSNPDKVKGGTRDRILQAIAQLGYVPDGAARALASGRARMVGAIVPTLDNAIFARAVQGLQSTLANAGYQLLISAHEYSLASETEATRALLERAVDALVLVGAEHAHETWEMVRASRIPVLITWTNAAAASEILTTTAPLIGFDNRLIGTLAAEHLLSLGHRTFGMISGMTRQNDRARHRLNGFRTALADAGVRLPEANVIEQPFGFDGGRAGLKHLMQLRPRPTAVFCGNDVLALGALFEAQSLEISVPDALSIVGCDNLPISSQITPGLSTVLLPTYELGQRAALGLLEWLSTERPPADVCLPIELVVRGTSGPAPA